VEGIEVKRVTLSGLALILLVVASTVWWQGCGLNPDKKPPVPPVLPPWPPESPADVMDNMKYAYTYFRPERYDALIDEEFLFYIWSGDLADIPSDLVDNGTWDRGVELELVDNMLTQGFVPRNPDTGLLDEQYVIDNMQMEWSFSEPPHTTNFEGSHPGTLEAYVNFDLQVKTRSQMVYSVHSRPLFYFRPDSTVSPVTYTIWLIYDGENLNNPE
jgi:hypothetical protein